MEVALKALVGQASCLSMNDGQDARPTKAFKATPSGNGLQTLPEYVTRLTSQRTKTPHLHASSWNAGVRHANPAGQEPHVSRW